MPYYQALQIEEMSRVNILYNLTPLFTLVGSYLFLHDRLNSVQLAAFFLLVGGAFIASLHFGGERWRVSRAFILMVFSTFMYAVSWLALEHVTKFIPLIHAYLFFIIFLILSSFLMFFSQQFRQDFAEHVRGADKKLVASLCTVAFFDHSGLFFAVLTMSSGFSSLFSALEGFQSIFVFLIAVIISLHAPKIFKEELDRKNVLLKLIAMVLMVVGIALLSL